MKMFQDKKATKLFVTLSDSFKTSIGRMRFTQAVKAMFIDKQMCEMDLKVYTLTATEIENVYNIIKQKYA